MKIFSNIEKRIIDKYHLKQNEFQKIFLLFSFSFCLGLFIAFYFVPANSEFVEYYGSKHLPLAYIFSGIVGTFGISFYSKKQKNSKNSRALFMSAVIVMLIISFFSRFLLYLLEHSKINFVEVDYERIKSFLSFFVFIWAWPFIALVGIITGGIALRLLNLIQIKKYFGFINIGGIIASILGYFIIPVFIKYLSHHYDFILIGSIGLIASILIIIKIYKLFPESQNVDYVDNEPEMVDNNFWKLLKKRFFVLIFLAASLSTIAIYISDYGFLVTIKEQDEIFKSKEIIALFLSVVFGLLKVGELIVSIYSSRILSNWGVRLGLLIMPVSILLLFVLAFFSSELFGINSLLFLTFITLNKSSERIIRRGIDDPSFNVLYQTLPENQKLFVQTRVGVIMQISIAVAGLILFLISHLLTVDNSFNLKLYPIFVIPFLLIWVFVAIKMYSAYKEKIRLILAEKQMFEFQYSENEVFGSQILEKHLLGEDINVATFSVVVLAETNPKSLEAYANFLLKIEDNIIRKVILKSIDPTYNEKISNTIETIGNKLDFKERELHKMILTSLYNLDYSEIKKSTIDEIPRLQDSNSLRDKIKLSKYLYKYVVENDEKIILDLLDSKDKAVKLAAIKIASKRKTDKLLKKLVALLENAEYNNLLVNIFVEIGAQILPYLDKYFEKNTNHVVILKIIEIYAKSGLKKAEDLLVSHLDFPDREIQSAIITALYYSEYKANTETKPIIKKKILQVSENILWFYVAIKDIEKEKNTLKLIQSLDLERENTYQLLFYLLSFIYPPETIDLIKTNIIGENTIFALEIIDNFISKDIKRIIIPLFDKLSVNQRIRKLKTYFYIPEIGFELRLKDIILKDYKKIDIWTQAKAIELYGKIIKKTYQFGDNEEFTINIEDNENWTEERAKYIVENIDCQDKPKEIIAGLYHDAELVYSTAAKMFYDCNPEFCIKTINKLSEKKQKLNAILTDENSLGIILDRVKLLKRIFLFYTLPEKSLVKLSRLIHSTKKKKDEKITFINKNGDEDIIILIKGSLIFPLKKNKKLSFSNNDVIVKGLHLPQTAEYLEVEKNSYVVFINRFEFFNLLVTDKEIINHLFDRMKF